MDNSFYEDKVRGGWIGKCLGGVVGMAYEGVPESPCIGESDVHFADVPNDDLEMQLIWMRGLKTCGLQLDAHAMGDLWRDYIPCGCDEYCVAIRNLRRGIEPPASGWKDNFFVDGMGATIRSEIWALVFAGSPNAAAHFAQLDAQVDHWGDGVYGEIFMAMAESRACVTSDIKDALRFALDHIPPQTRLRKTLEAVFALHDANKTQEEAYAYIYAHIQHASNFTYCVMNLSFIVYALLWGEGDFIRTVLLAVNCGRDTDCTGASCGAFLGIAHGMAAIPEQWRSAVADTLTLSDYVKKVPGVPMTLSDLIRETIELHETLTSSPLPTYADYVPEVPTEDIPSLDAQQWLVLENLSPEETAAIEREIIGSKKCPERFRDRVVSFDGLIMDLSSIAHDACHLTLFSVLDVENGEIPREQIQLCAAADVGSQLWIDGVRFTNHHSRAKMIPAFHRTEGGQTFHFPAKCGQKYVFRLELFFCLPPLKACVMFGDVCNNHLDGFRFDI